ncbi:MAG: enoyl-CoA hydratase/isomerase family protein [Desulfofustis sp.]|nr:enoyl-CoA hydratase/isomerase family protein [Desulfofustis sp.]
MAQPTSPIKLSREKKLAFIAINRDEKLNALSWEMIQDLKSCFEALDLDREIRSVILFSESSRSFGVGADIKDWAALEPIEMWRTWTRHGHRIMKLIDELIHPVIAVVNGHAYGGSLELALAADLRIGEVGSRYGFPEALVGTIPGWFGTKKALQLIGPSRLKKLIFTGLPISAEEALEIGLIDELVPAGEGLIRARELATLLDKTSPVSVQLGKQIVNSLASGQPASALESIGGGLAALSSDGREGKEAFVEKRSPAFKGF